MNAIDFTAWRHDNLVSLVKDLLKDNENLRKELEKRDHDFQDIEKIRQYAALYLSMGGKQK